MFEKILVATDGSELSGQGVDAAVELASKIGAQLVIVTVTSLMPSYGIVMGAEWAAGASSAFEDFRQSMEEEARRILDAALDKARAANVAAQGVHVENQLAAVGIVETAREHDVGLIVLASHGRRGVTRLILGSQASEVMAMSSRPVMVVKNK